LHKSKITYCVNMTLTYFTNMRLNPNFA